jgi:peptidoglycan hydrolase-like protein with peptidoglycan-binding domain
MKTSKLSLAATAVVTGIFGLIPASPAAAATPKCTIRELWGSTDAGVGFVWAPLNSSGTTAKCGMRKGDSSAAVYALQDAIVHCYFINIGVDGDFGTSTYNALRTVQSQIGASVDGVYGPGTASRIMMRPDDTPASCGRLY